MQKLEFDRLTQDVALEKFYPLRGAFLNNCLNPLYMVRFNLFDCVIHFLYLKYSIVQSLLTEA